MKTTRARHAAIRARGEAPTPRTRSRYVGVITATALLLAGCSTSTSPTTSADPTPSMEAASAQEVEDTPPLEPMPEVIEAAAGDVITDSQAELLPQGQHAYQMESGELIVVDANEPLPGPVREQAKEIFEAHIATGEISSAPYDDFERSTGKEIVVVAYVPHLSGANKWGVGGVRSPLATKAEAIATAEAHIAAQENSDNWELIVVD